MNTRAPLLSALIIILGSAGPVISTRRSTRSAGASATRQSPSRTAAVSGRKSSGVAGGQAPPPLPPPREQLPPARPELALERATNASASGVRMRSASGGTAAVTFDALAAASASSDHLHAPAR